MRGPIEGVGPLVAPLFYSFTQVREDLALHTAGVGDDDVWRRVGPLPPLGFQLRHIAGSVDRLSTYLLDEELQPEQIAFLKQEATPGSGMAELMSALDNSLTECEERLKRIDPATLYDPRYIGRRRLPSTVLGLLVHIAEHTQRHLGQAITTAKLLRDGAA